MKKVKGVKFGNVEVLIEGSRDCNEDYDFGTLTLKCEDREFKMDVIQSYTNEVGDGNTRITLDIEPDEELYEDCPYNLTKEDLLDCEHNDLVKEIYIGGTFENEILSIDLFFEVDGKDYQLKLERD